MRINIEHCKMNIDFEDCTIDSIIEVYLFSKYVAPFGKAFYVCKI